MIIKTPQLYYPDFIEVKKYPGWISTNLQDNNGEWWDFTRPGREFAVRHTKTYILFESINL